MANENKQIRITVQCSMCEKKTSFWSNDTYGFENRLLNRKWKNIVGHWVCGDCVEVLRDFNNRQEKDKIAFLTGKLKKG